MTVMPKTGLCFCPWQHRQVPPLREVVSSRSKGNEGDVSETAVACDEAGQVSQKAAGRTQAAAVLFGNISYITMLGGRTDDRRNRKNDEGYYGYGTGRLCLCVSIS